jgi:hypothetical protein
MAGNGFKYIIQTDLQLKPGALNKLLQDISSVDTDIRNKGVTINARLDPNAKIALQREVGNIKSTIRIQARLDQSSISAFKRELDVAISGIKKDVEIALKAKTTKANQSSAQVNAPQANRPVVENPLIRLPQRDNTGQSLNKQDKESKINARNALEVKRLAEAYRDVQKVQNDSDKLGFAKESRDLRLEASARSKLAKSNKTFQDAQSEMSRMATNMGKHFLFHATIAAGFYKIAEGAMHSISVMKEFESEFLRISNLSNQRNEEAPKAGFNNTERARKDIFDLGKRYGRDPIKDVMPVYSEILRRSDLADSPEKVQMLTQMIIREGIVSHGNDAKSEDFNQLGQDAIGISALMFPHWQKQGKNPLQELNSFFNKTAVMSRKGVHVDKLMEALGDDLIPLVTNGKSGLDFNDMASLVGAFQNNMGDMSGKESANTVKMFITNLSKTSGTQAANINRALGTTNQNKTAKEKLAIIRSKTATMTRDEKEVFGRSFFTDGEQESIAMSAASSGSGGSSRTSQFIGLMNSTPLAETFDKLGSPASAAENAAKSSTQTLAGLLGILNAAFQDMSVTLGDTGLLDAIKTVIKMTTILVETANALLKPLALLHGNNVDNKVSSNQLGKDTNEDFKKIGTDIASFISLAIASGLAVKGLTLAKGIFFNQAGKIAEQASGPLASAIPMMVGGVGSKASTALSRAEAVAQSKAVWKAESASGFGLNLLGLGGLAKNTGTLGVVSSGEKVASLFTKMIIPLSEFGLLITRLTLWGAAIGGVVAAISYVANKVIAKQEDRGTRNYNRLMDDPNSGDYLEKKLSEMTDLKTHYDATQGKLFDPDNFFHVINPDLTKQKKIQKDIATSFGGDISYNKDWSIGVKTKNEAEDAVTHNFDATDKGKEDLALFLKSLKNNLKVSEQMYLDDRGPGLDLPTMLAQINGLGKSVDDRNSYSTLANKINDINFTGAKDSSSYLLNGMTISKNSIGGLSSQYDTVANQKDELATQLMKDNNRVKLSGSALSTEIKNQLDAEFEAAKAKGSSYVGEFQSKYKTDDASNQQALLLSSYANDKFNLNADIDTATKLDEVHKKTIDTLTTEVAKYKELYAQYMLASTGVTLLETAMKGLAVTLSTAKTNFSLAVGENNKINASVDVFGELAKQARVYSVELEKVNNASNNLKKNNPNEDFSLTALYDPSRKLSDNQNTEKLFIEKKQEITKNQNDNTDALKQQSDAIVDLIMNTQKYKSTWDSVNTRIEFSKVLTGQIRDINTKATVDGMVGGLKQSIMGNQYDAGATTKQNAEQRRDSFISLFEQAQKASVTYGDDAGKLKEALSEINGATLGEKLKSAFINPLKNIVDIDLKSAATNQLEASKIFATTVETLQKVLDAESKNIKVSPLGVVGKGDAQSYDQKQSIEDSYFGKDTSAIVRGQIIGKEFKNMSADEMFAYMKDEIEKRNGSNGSYSTLNKSNVSTEGIDKILKGTALDGHGQDFMDAGNAHGIDPSYLVGLAKAEQSYTNPYGSNNVTGITSDMGYGDGRNFKANDKQNLASFGSIKDGLLAAAKNLRNYADGAYGGSKTSVDDISKTWVGTVSGDTNWKNEASTIKGVISQLNSNYTPSMDDSTSTPPVIPTKVTELSVADQQAQDIITNKKTMEGLTIGAMQAHVESLGANNIDYTFNNSEKQAGIESNISRMATNYQGGYYDAVKSARLEVGRNKLQAGNARDEYQRTLDGGVALDKAGKPILEDGKTVALTTEMKKALQDNIKAIDKNNIALDALGAKFADLGYLDPRKNGDEARNQISHRTGELQDLINSGQGGGVEAYAIREDINRMFSEYNTRKKDIATSQELFDNTGMDYKGLGNNKQVKYGEDSALLLKQLDGVALELNKFTEGTTKWHVILEDAVMLQQKVIDLENKKTQMAKSYFEMTNQGLGAYINARAYQQSRDYHNASNNTSSAIDNYKNHSSIDPNEQLSNIQVIADSYNKSISIVNDYKTAITDAFKAGGLSLSDYIDKMNGLRDVQAEIRDQALTMTDSMQGGFQQSLSGALKSGIQGSFTAPLDFVQGIKDSLASAVSTQMSNIVLKQSGLQDTMNSLIQSMVGGLTTGDANTSINAFNGTDMKKLLQDKLAPFLPLITQISESTKGMFGVLKDQTYNAPSGFKIDSYLYEMQKGKSLKDIANWLPNSNPTNEAGSPLPLPTSGPIVLPPKVKDTTGDLLKGIGAITKPIENVLPNNIGSMNTPLIKNPDNTTVNPVKQLIQGIIDMQSVYNNGKSPDDPNNMAAHEEARLLRQTLSTIPETAGILNKIGDGLTPESMGISELQNLMHDQTLGQFDVRKSVDGVGTGISTGISGMTGALGIKLDGVISGIASVYNGLTQKIATPVGPIAVPAPSSSGGSGGSGGGGGTFNGGFVPIGNGSSSDDGEGSSGSSGGFVPIGNGSSLLDNYQGTVDPNEFRKSLDDLGIPHYHTGGIAGMMNFSGLNLKSNEIHAVLKNEETIFQKGQLGSFINGVFGRGSGGSGSDSSSRIAIDVNITGADGMDNSTLQTVVKEAVTKAVYEIGRQGRLNNLQTKGVAY